MERVINLLISQLEFLKERQNRLELITETYHEFKEEKETFIKYLKEKVDKLNKDRASDSVPDDKREKVPESKWSTWPWGFKGKKKSNYKRKRGNDNENIWNII